MKDFSPRKSVSLFSVVAALCLGVSGAWAQTTLLSNLPTNNGGDGPTTNTEVRAVTFKTGSSDFQVTSVTMQLYNYFSANPDVPLLSFKLSGDSSVSAGPGSSPGAQVGSTLTAPSSSSGASAPFSFSPVGTLTLSANTWYWLVMAGTSTTNPFEWVRSGPEGVTPTGSVGATFGSQMINYNSGAAGHWQAGNNGPHSFAIQGSAVPEPASILLLVVGGLVFVVARQRRLAARR